MDFSKKIYMILTNGFDPDVRVHKEATYLVNNGYDVEILCWDRKCIYLNKEVEELEGIKIRRFFIPSVPGTGLKQLNAYLKFIKKVRNYLKGKEYKYLHCHDLDGMMVGLFVKKSRIKKIIFDMHEFYESGRFSKVSLLIRKVVQYFQKKAYRIIYVNEQQLKNLKEKNKSKLVFLPNYPDSETFKNIKHIESAELRITYAGYVRHYIQMKNLIDSVENVDGVKVNIYGMGEYYSKIEDDAKSNKNVYMGGKFTHKDLINIYSNTDLIYCVYNKENANDRTALPTKFFEAIICKIPIIVANNTLMADWVKKYDIGFCIDSDSSESIDDLFKKLLNNKKILKIKKENICKISNNFSWENMVKGLDMIYVDK